MKKRVLVCLTVLLTLCIAVFSACGETKPKQTTLATPVVGIVGDVIGWEEVENASAYEIYVNGQLKDTIRFTNYEFIGMAIGEYSITVKAKSSNTELYLDSELSSAVSYSVTKQFLKLEKISDPNVTTYYVDENKSLDLTGLEVVKVYKNANNESVVLTAENIVSQYDLTVKGDYDLVFEYTEGNLTSRITVKISVKERTADTIDEYTVFTNEVTQSKYKIYGGVASVAYTMAGTEIEVITEDDATFVTSDKLTEGEHLLRVNNEFVLVIVARYVSTVADFNDIANNLNGYYLLTNDIDFSEQTCTPIGRAPIKQVGENCLLDTTGDGGTAFNGTFNGNGYAIKNFKFVSAPDERYYEPKAYGWGLFGFVGETGKVCNLVLRNVSINGGAYNAFVAGYNLGVIENILVEDSCYLYNNYGKGAVVSAYNYGTVKNIVSYVDKCSYAYGDGKESISVVRQEEDFTGATGENGYICNYTDLTSVLGGDWTYIEDYGTVLANDNYKKVLYADKVWTNGNQVQITLWQKVEGEPYFSVWGTSASDVTTVLKYVSYDQTTGTYTFDITVELTVGNTYTVGVGVAGRYFEIFEVTVAE